MAKKKNMEWLETTAKSILVIGGINVGLVALKFNLIEKVLGVATVATRVVYGAVGLSALYVGYCLLMGEK